MNFGHASNTCFYLLQRIKQIRLLRVSIAQAGRRQFILFKKQRVYTNMHKTMFTVVVNNVD